MLRPGPRRRRGAPGHPLAEGRLLAIMGRFDEALDSFTQAEQEGDPRAAEGVKFCRDRIERRREYDELLQETGRELEDHPADAQLWNTKGAALAILERFDEAIRCFDRAVELDPSCKEAWSNRAQTLMHLGRAEEAIDRAAGDGRALPGGSRGMAPSCRGC